MLAIDVFSAALKYLMEQLLNALKQNINYKKEKKIKWVITVPGVWCDAAKQFMRDAAEKVMYPEFADRSPYLYLLIRANRVLHQI